MKKFAGFVAAGAGALAMGFAGTASAAPSYEVTGNFQHPSALQYWCDNGHPNFSFSYRTLNLTESSVTTSATGFTPYVSKNVSPYSAGQNLYALTGVSKLAGTTITVTAKGATSGTSFSITGKVPSSCAGLPTEQPMISWSSVPRATAQPSTPAPTTSAPAPTTSAPAPTTSAPAPTTSAPAPTTSAPAPTDTTTGPKVDTDYVGSDNNSQAAMVAALGGAALVAGAGSVVVARRRK